VQLVNGHYKRDQVSASSCGPRSLSSTTELKELMMCCPDWLPPIAVVAVSTGMRRSEILSLRWLDVDIAHQRVLLPQTKNGEGRIVYLNKSAQSVLMVLPFDSQTRPTDRLFPDIEPANPEALTPGLALSATK